MNKLAVVSLLMVACVLMSDAMPRGRTSRAGAHTDPNHDDQHHEESGTSLSEQEKLSESLSTHERGLDELRAHLQGESSRQNVSMISIPQCNSSLEFSGGSGLGL